jgi:hypothetical protein
VNTARAPHSAATNQASSNSTSETNYRRPKTRMWATAQNDERTRRSGSVLREKSGDVLLSQGHSSQVPSALTGLTSVFGMGTGVTLSLWSPKTLSLKLSLRPERARRAP